MTFIIIIKHPPVVTANLKAGLCPWWQWNNRGGQNNRQKTAINTTNASQLGLLTVVMANATSFANTVTPRAPTSFSSSWGGLS
jgi:hypothetical protein